MTDAGPGYDLPRRVRELEALVGVQDDLLRRAARALEELDRRLAAVERTAPTAPLPAALRRCATCRADLAGRRAHAVYCSPRCRWRGRQAHASRTLRSEPPTDRSR